MGSYNYHGRVERLRRSGLEVAEFGARTLQQGAYGDDVVELQSFLSGEGYFNSADGLSGYFGAVTKEAVQNWQRDAGLAPTGVFNTDCKWAYLRQQEAKLAAARAAEQAVHVSAAPPSIADSAPYLSVATSAQPLGVAFQLGLGAAVVAAAVRAYRFLQRQGNRPGVPAGRPARAQAAALPPQSALPATGQAGATAAPGAAARAAAQALPARQPQARAEAAPAAAAAAQAPGAGAGVRRLSEEELQRRIAVMKGQAPPKTPLQRPAPKPLPLGSRPPSDDPVLGSKYGMYYGGREVLDKVKQFIEQENGIGIGGGAAPGGRRILGFSMPQPRRRPRPAPAPEAATPAPPALQEGGALAQAGAPSSGELFLDVASDAAEEGSGGAADLLLAGTELEAAPERAVRRVPVVRPNGYAPAPAAAAPAAPAPRPKPVPVVKPQRQVTIGEMIASVGGEEGSGGGSYDGAATAPAAAAPAGVRYTDDGNTVVLASKPAPLAKPAALLHRTYGRNSDRS
eukprot:scaffold3.g6426.t1